MSKESGPQRDLRKEKFWRKLVDGFNPERTTVRQWCADHGVSEPSFYGWRRELKRRDGEGTPRPRPKQRVQLLPVKIAPSSAAMLQRPKAKVMIRLASGTRLSVSIEQLAAVLDVLETRSC